MSYINKDWYNSGAPTRKDGKKLKACQLWENLRYRVCVLGNLSKTSRQKSYTEATCCDQWRDYALFYKWFEEQCKNGYYKDGWQLDKECVKQGNKHYCPELCRFIPKELNNLLTEQSRKNEFGLTGVVLEKSGKYSAHVRTCYKKNAFYGFDTPEAAHAKYVEVKKQYILEVLYAFADQLSEDIVLGIKRWEVK